MKALPVIAMLLAVIVGGCKKDDVTGPRPVVTSTTPLNTSTGVVLNSKILASFSMAMDPASITASQFFLKQGTTAIAGAITYSETTAVLTPAVNLTANTVYTATITTGAKNPAGVGLAKDYVWSFTTGAVMDTTVPTATLTDPLNNATSVTLNHQVAVTFSKAMDPASINGSTFTVKDGTNSVAGTVTYNSSDHKATFTPNVNLTPNTVYTATVTLGAKDMAGHSLANVLTFNFNTGATAITLPMVNSTNPVSSSVGFPTGSILSASFSKVMDPLTINVNTFTLKQGSTPVTGVVSYSGTTATFAPSAPLAVNTQYTATVSTGAKDAAGNALAANIVWSFTTAASVSNLAAVNLGSAINYVILAKTAVSNIATSAITGDLGLSPAATSFFTGFSLTNATGYATASQVTGKLYAADMASPTPINLTTAVGDMITAYNDAAGRPTPDFSELATGNLGGRTLTPGLYKWTNTVTLPSSVTISGGPNDVWIFQIAGDLIMSNAVNVTLIGGAQAKNIFWQVAGQTTFGTTSHFEGIVLCMTAIHLQTGASWNGRALAQTAVTLDQNIMVNP